MISSFSSVVGWALHRATIPEAMPWSKGQTAYGNIDPISLAERTSTMVGRNSACDLV